jgi:tetratricopeptide (TPR) repeat protein
MIRNSCLIVASIFILAAVVLGPGASGDADVAKLLFKKAEKAARAKKYDEAAALFKRALDEHSPYPEAAFGLAIALEKHGKTEEALAAYLRCRDEIAGMKSPSRKVKAMDGKALKAIKKLGAGYAELQDIDRAFVKECLGIGKRNLRSNPPWAKRAFETVLAIDPQNKLALSYMERLSGVSGPAAIQRPFAPLLEDDGMGKWNPGARGPWSCSGGVLTGDTSDLKGHANIFKERLEGTYSFRASFRVTRASGAKRTHGIFFGDKTDRTVWAFIISWDDEVVLSRWRGSDHVEERMKILTKFDPEKWHTLQVDVTPGKVECLIDGREMFELAEQPAKTFDGTPLIFIQDMRVEIRGVGVRR